MSHHSGPVLSRKRPVDFLGHRIAAIAAAAELLPGQADFDALDAEDGVVALLALIGGTAVRNIGDAMFADLSAAVVPSTQSMRNDLPVRMRATSPPCT